MLTWCSVFSKWFYRFLSVLVERDICKIKHIWWLCVDRAWGTWSNQHVPAASSSSSCSSSWWVVVFHAGQNRMSAFRAMNCSTSGLSCSSLLLHKTQMFSEALWRPTLVKSSIVASTRLNSCTPSDEVIGGNFSVMDLHHACNSQYEEQTLFLSTNKWVSNRKHLTQYY